MSTLIVKLELLCENGNQMHEHLLHTSLSPVYMYRVES